MRRNQFTADPRMRLLHAGPDALDDMELLAVLLHHGLKSAAAVALSRALLERFHGLAGVGKAGVWSLSQVPRMSALRAAQLASACELSLRLAEPPDRLAAPIVNPGDSRSYFKARLGQNRRETFACLYLDTRHRPIDFKILFEGTVDSAAVYPREVVRYCLERDATAVIAGHNHPSGVAEPSHADLAITRRLKEALALLDIRLLDHLIVTDRQIYSFAESGRL